MPQPTKSKTAAQDSAAVHLGVEAKLRLSTDTLCNNRNTAEPEQRG